MKGVYFSVMYKMDVVPREKNKKNNIIWKFGEFSPLTKFGEGP
jgi:hypothetical protein